MRFEHVRIVVDPGPPRQIQHHLMRDGERWATITILTEDSPRELWTNRWLEREEKRLNHIQQRIHPGAACVPSGEYHE